MCFILVPDRRRLGHVNVVCICTCWQEEGEKRGSGGWVRDLKVGQLTLTMSPSRVEVRSFLQRSIIPYSQSTTYAISNIMCSI
jgi:hypothetical protein